MKDLTKDWLKQAAYDLETAASMLKTGRYLYVAFMCQQAIEKLIKGLIHEKTDKPPPYIHRLTALIEIAGLRPVSDRLDFFDILTRHYINCRYPEQKRKLSNALNKKTCTELLKQTRECFQWLKNELKTSGQS